MQNAVNKSKLNNKYTIEHICLCYNMHRDAYYKFNKRYNQRISFNNNIISLVKNVRKEQPRIGTRKLLKLLEYEFKKIQ